MHGFIVVISRWDSQTSTEDAPIFASSPRTDPFSITKGVVELHPRPCPEPKRAFLGLLGWNSYGTEGAQPVAKVGIAKLRKMA